MVDMVAGLTGNSSTIAQRAAAIAATSAAAAQAAKNASTEVNVGGGAQPVQNNNPVPNTKDVLDGLSTKDSTALSTASQGIGKSTVFDKADTFGGGYNVSSLPTPPPGTQILKDSQDPNGYIYTAGGNVYSSSGKFLSSQNPNATTVTKNGVSAPAQLSNYTAPLGVNQGQGANPPIDYQTFGTQAAATIKPVTVQAGSEQAQVYQVTVDGAKYITSVGYQGNNINGVNQAIDQAYNLYLSALNQLQNQAITTGITNTITGADANTGQINLTYSPSTVAQIAPQAEAQPVSGGYNLSSLAQATEPFINIGNNFLPPFVPVKPSVFAQLSQPIDLLSSPSTALSVEQFLARGQPQSGLTLTNPLATQQPKGALDYTNTVPTSGMQLQSQKASNTSALNPYISGFEQIVNSIGSQVYNFFPSIYNQLTQFNSAQGQFRQQTTAQLQAGQITPEAADYLTAQSYVNQGLGNIGIVASRLPIIDSLSGFIQSQPWISSAIQSNDPVQKVIGLSEILGESAILTRLLLSGATAGATVGATAAETAGLSGEEAASLGASQFNIPIESLAQQAAIRLGIGAAIGAPLYAGIGALFGEAQPQQIASNILKGAQSGATFSGVFGGIEQLPGTQNIAEYLQSIENPYAKATARGLYGAGQFTGASNIASVLQGNGPAPLSTDISSAVLGGTLSGLPIGELVPRFTSESFGEGFKYKGITFRDLPIVGTYTSIDTNGNPVTKFTFGTPSYADLLTNPRGSQSPFPTSLPEPVFDEKTGKAVIDKNTGKQKVNFAPAETPTGESANLLLTPLGRQIFIKSLSLAADEMPVEAEYGLSGIKIAQALKAVKLVSPDSFNLDLKRFNTNEDTALTNIVKKYANDDLIERIYGSSSLHVQAPEDTRAGADLDPNMVSQEALDAFNKEVVDELNKISPGKFVVKGNTVTYAYSGTTEDGTPFKAGQHLIDGHIASQEPATSGYSTATGPKTQLGLKLANPVDIEGVPTESASTTLLKKLASSLGVRVASPADVITAPEGWQEYLSKYFSGKTISGDAGEKTTLAPSNWRIKDVIDSYTTAKLLNDYNLNPVSRITVDASLENFKSAAEIKFGLTDADFNTGKADITSLVKGDPTASLNNEAGTLFQASAPVLPSQGIAVAKASVLTPASTTNPVLTPLNTPAITEQQKYQVAQILNDPAVPQSTKVAIANAFRGYESTEETSVNPTYTPGVSSPTSTGQYVNTVRSPTSALNSPGQISPGVSTLPTSLPTLPTTPPSTPPNSQPISTTPNSPPLSPPTYPPNSPPTSTPPYTPPYKPPFNPPEPPPKKQIPPGVLLANKEGELLKQQKEARPPGKIFGVYQPDVNFLGESGPVATGALLGIGERPQYVSPQDVATLNNEGIAVPYQNQAQPSALPQAVTTQTGTVLVDPLTLQESTAQAATAGLTNNPGALVNQIPQNLRLVLNTLPPSTAQALEQNYLAGNFEQGTQQIGGLNALPASTETAITIPGQTQSIEQAQVQGSSGIAQTIPQSPILANSPNPAIQSMYQNNPATVKPRPDKPKPI